MDDLSKPLVLLVEDYQDAREMYTVYLRFAGYRVAEASNGVEAIEKTRALLPDIVVMDLALPKKDGWQATSELKADEKTRHIPIVALTGHTLVGHAESARHAGCDSFLGKPCQPDMLVAEIERVLATSKQRSNAPRSPGGGQPGQPGQQRNAR
jgi:CheY-like chemotaxis protein